MILTRIYTNKSQNEYMYFIKLIKDIRLWYKFAKIAKASRQKLEKHNLRVDNIGRIYTVINLPEEAAEGNEYMHEAWVLKNLGPYNKALEEIGLAGYAYPEMERIKEPGSAAYLLVLYPDTPTIGWKPVIKNIIIYFVLFMLARIGYNILNNSFDLGKMYHNAVNYIF